MKLEPALKLDNIIIWAVITLTVLTCFDATHAERACNKKNLILQNPKDGVCFGNTDNNIDIRNNVTNLRKLENCTVVEGSVHISLIDRTDPSEFDSYSFPLLTEITGHLMLFRVHGLRSLKKMFPNLAVIRGQDLFYNYALVAYEMRDLEEIGLINLRTIVRGGVRITKNKKLCYVDTIDWSHIAIGADPSEHNFMDNKEERQCANYCPENCPTSVVDNVSAKRCWTSQHCQKNLNCPICKDNAPCMEDRTCCHHYCLGGCSGPGPSDCLGCKGVSYMNKCEPRCPPNTYMFSETRCLIDKECLGLRNRTGNGGKKTMLLQAPEQGEYNKCVVGKCPSGYSLTEEGELKGLECVKCKDFCPIVCNSSEVNSIQDLQNFKGCNTVIGSLAIQIMGGSTVAKELNSLGEIREVTGYVSIHRSYALLHLYFLKNLEIIGGETLTNQGHSLSVTDNANLQELFPEGQKLKIKKGKVAFHTNRRLCPDKIWNFVNKLNLTETPTIYDISNSTNGDLKPCVKKMNLTATKIRHDSAVLIWDTDVQDLRQLLTYNINYKEVDKDEDNLDIYLGRDACSDDVWMKREQPPTNDEPHQLGLVPELKPYTKYVAYVQAFTLTSASHSAMTNIVTFTTKPYYPSEPEDLVVASTDNPTELHVKWKPPKRPNGEVTHYQLFYTKQPLNPDEFDQRDYCDEPLQQRKDKKVKVKEEEKKLNVSGNCCLCPKSKKELEKDREKQELEVFFENHLQNNVYCKRYDTLPQEIDIEYIKNEWQSMNSKKRKKGKLGNSQMNNATAMERIKAFSANNTKSTEEKAKMFKFDNVNTGNIDVYNYTETVIPNLEPFMEYQIEIQACQDTNSDTGVSDQLCSNRAITVGRTKASWVQDMINESSIAVEHVANTTSDVLIRWLSPPKPNGLIVKYTLMYKRANQDNLVAQKFCVNRQDYKKYKGGYPLRHLDPGNWTFQINAVSLAGNTANNSFTKEKFFVIPHLDGESDKSKIFVVSVVIAFLLLLLLCLLVVFVVVKHRFQNGDMTVVSQNMNYLASSDLIDTMDGWEVDRDKIKILSPLGKGSFGMVYKGIAKGIRQDSDEELWVAVKTVNDRANFFDRREFLKEATTMKAFDCYHVVKLLGVVSTGQPALVIMELMAKDLKNYLREHRPEELEPGMSAPRIQDILQMAGEIADGMAYLADKKFVHRDLAARNCMVAEDSTVKIGDFGMARDIYETDYYRKGGKGMLPVRWMAPESLRDGVFTTTSDVWSFGVVLWEMVTLAAQPYQGLSNEEVVKFISDGKIMAVPHQCPEQMEKLMLKCWMWKQRDRPSFIDIIQYLEPYLNTKFKQVSFYFNSGPHQGDGGAALSSQENVMDKGRDNLSHKGAAALPTAQDYDYQSSPHSGDDNFCSTLLYRDPNDFRDVDVNNFCHHQQRNEGSYGEERGWEGSSQLDESFEEGTDFVYNCDGDGMEGNDSRCFMGGEYQSVPSVMPASLSSPSSLREEPTTSSNHPSQPNQGLFELQPLISKKDPLSSSASPHNLPSLNKNQSSHPTSVSASDYIGYDPVPKGTNKNVNAPNYNSQSPHQNNEPVLLPLATPAGDHERQNISRSNPAGPSLRPSGSTSSTSAPTSSSSRPSLRLPVLNQPPGGGFRRGPQTTDSGSRNNNSSSQNLPPLRNSSSFPSSNSSAHAEKSNSDNEEDISPAFVPPDHPSSPPSGAIDSISSDGSKESTKSSGSHSLMNGLTNGHAPSSSMQHRTALC